MLGEQYSCATCSVGFQRELSRRFIVFRPTIFWLLGRKIIICLAFFLRILPNLHNLHFSYFSYQTVVSCYFSNGGSSGSACPYHAVDSGFESCLRLAFLLGEKYPVAWRASCTEYTLVESAGKYLVLRSCMHG